MLTTSQLHASLMDPVLDSLNFLNEIINRFPNAISFAPGAPNPTHLSNIDIGNYISKYVQYLREHRNLNQDQAQRLLCQYGPAQGLINDLIANALRNDKSIDVSPSAIVITVGAQEAMLITLRALFISSRYQLAVVNPCFVGILGAARLLNIDVIGIEETEAGIDLKRLEEACHIARQNNQPIRALYVAPDYSNPAGTVLTLEARQQLLDIAEQQDFYILEDNAYGFTSPLGEEIPSLKALDINKRVIFIGTFAKICLPGARVGYVIADQLVDEENGRSHLLSKDLATIKSMVTVNTSPICQALVGGMLLEYGGSISALERARSTLYQNNLTILLNALTRRLATNTSLMQAISWSQPKGGFFVRMRLPVAADMALLELSASKYGVLWTPMSSFYVNNGGTHELRLSCSYLTPPQIEEGIDRLAAFLQNITDHDIKRSNNSEKCL